MSSRAARAPARRIARTGHAEAAVAAPAEAVWRVVTDVTRTGEWSHECQRVTWLGGAASAVPGARFRGRNQAGLLRWHRLSEITAVRAPRELRWRTLPTLRFPDSTEWTILVEPDGPLTRITVSYRVVRLPAVLDWLFARLIPAHRDRGAGLTSDLQRLGAVAAADAARAQSR